MSTWHEADKDELSLSDEKDELHIWLYQDYGGSVYASVKVADVIEFLKKQGVIK